MEKNADFKVIDTLETYRKITFNESWSKIA
jgi:hypothetical protein